MIIFDSHTHNTFSHDGIQTPEEQLNTAIEKGFKGYAVTDHCEIEDSNWIEVCEKNIPLSIAKATEFKKQYADKIIISVGAEIGGALFEKEKADKIIKENNLDFILCSCHNAKGQHDYCQKNYTKEKDIPALLRNYFEILEESSRVCDFDSLSHITYPLRYITGNYGIAVDMNQYKSIIEKTLVNLIKRDKAMEVNTSGFRQKIGVSMPDGNIINLYKKLGGKLITIGSDAHKSEDMGKDFDRTFTLLKECGFDRYYYYQNRQPKEILL